MSVNTKIYDKKFFATSLKLEAGSAGRFVKILYKHFSPESVVDIGCGPGLYLAKFKKYNAKVLGFDGAPAARAGSLIGNRLILHDLTKPLKIKQRFDLCLCLEVAEHLPKSAARTLIGSLVRLADTIVFTAATPGQGPVSIGHINERPPEYWRKLFAAKEFILNKKVTQQIKREMEKAEIIWWLTKNLMIYEKAK